jgi:hypothetical protein
MKECVILRGEIATLEEDSIAMTIVIAPSEEEAKKHAEKVLNPYFSGYPQRIGFFYVGPIYLLQPVTKTVLLCKNGEMESLLF